MCRPVISRCFLSAGGVRLRWVWVRCPVGVWLPDVFVVVFMFFVLGTFWWGYWFFLYVVFVTCLSCGGMFL